MRLASIVRSAVLAVACLFPISASAAPDRLPEGLYDFSITYTKGHLDLSLFSSFRGRFGGLTLAEGGLLGRLAA